LKDPAPQPLRQPQKIYGPENTYLRRLHWIMLIMNRRGGACEIVYLIGFDVQRKANIVPNEFETGMVSQMRDVRLISGKQIVDTDDFVAAINQSIDEMGSKETGTTSNSNSPATIIIGHLSNTSRMMESHAVTADDVVTRGKRR
jgi:hypothetical protein